MNPDRRVFLEMSGGLTVMLVLGGIGRATMSKDILRPPGGQDELNFISKCIKCDRCRSICPTSVIGAVHADESFLDARTPVMKYHIGYCDFCGKCVEVCPTDALRPFERKSAKIGLAAVTDRCIAWNSGGCTACGKQCPEKAIAFDALKRPVVNSEKCNGCGLCEKICPALVLRSYEGGTLRGIQVRPVRRMC
jgi:ferredoxin-type protein NapG